MERRPGITRREFLKWVGIGTGSFVFAGPVAGYLKRSFDGVVASPRVKRSVADIFPVEYLDELLEDITTDAARELLEVHSRFGSINEDTYRYVIPSPRYPNYWYWDSMLAAISASYVEPELARGILETQALIFREFGLHGPQIIYFNQSPFPLEHRVFLKTRTVNGVDQLTQTPLSGLALEVYAIKTGDLRTVKRVLPDYSAHYAWLMENRGLDRSIRLPVIIHPFEGLDSQPAVDLMYRKHLGTNTQFRAAAARWLLHGKRNSFDAQTIARTGGFVMYDTCFLAFYIRSLFSLGKLWELCGDSRESAYWHAQAALALEDFIDACFDPESGFFYGRRANGQRELLKVKTASGLFPLLLRLPPKIVDALVQNLTDLSQFVSEDLYISFVARNETGYYQEPAEPLWRGPGSPVVDFVVTFGLYENSREALADEIHEAQYQRLLHRLYTGYPFPEFYLPEKSFGHPYTWGTLAVCNPRELVYQEG